MDHIVGGYGANPVLRDVSMEVQEGEIVGLLGPNGAGKSTALLMISGILRPQSGRIRILENDIEHRPAHAIARMGCSHVPEDRGLFLSLTVRENLSVAGKLSEFEAILGRFPALVPLMNRRAGLLSGGEQQMLAVARALAAKPKFLMIDEMSLGLAPLITKRLLQSVSDIARETGCAVLLVEQHVSLALGIADRAYVLNRGRVVLEGEAEELTRDPSRLQHAYLGHDSQQEAV